MSFDTFLGALASAIRATVAGARARPLTTFLVTAFAFSWSDWLSLLWSGERVVPGRLPTDMAGMVGPAFAAFAATAVGSGEEGLRALGRRLLHVPLRSPWLWVLAPAPAWLALAWMGARVAMGLPVPGADALAVYPGLPRMPLYTVFDVVLVGVGFGQEIGWRGFALPRLQERFGPLGGSLVVALAWGAWLLPLLALHGPRGAGAALSLAGVAVTALLVVASSVVLAFVLARTGGSIAAAALWHASFRLATGTTGAGEGMALVVAGATVAWAAVLVLAEAWARRTGRSWLVALPARD